MFAETLADSTTMSRVVAVARLGGKATPRPRPGETRVITPLPAWLQIADAMMATKLHKWASDEIKLTSASFRCGVPGTQVMDISHGCISAQEKCMGSRSRGAMAQMDVKQYSDSVHIPGILDWAKEWRGPMALLRALLRAQVLPIAKNQHRGDAITIVGRFRGTLTGTRGAVALGRISVEACMEATESERSRHSWRLDDQRLVG